MLPSIVRAYEHEGYRFRLGSPRLFTTGVHPIGRAMFPTDRDALPVSECGFTMTDYYFFLMLGRELRPRRAIVIGNAFGISAICLAEGLKPLSVDAIDAQLHPESECGAELTRRVAARLGLDIVVHRAFSPRDLGAALRFVEFDLVFVDGLHTSGQIVADFTGVAPRLADRAAVVFHDIGLLGMDEGWARIKALAAPLGFRGFDLTFTDYGTTALLRGLPQTQAMLASVCPGLRDFNEHYQVGYWWHEPGDTPDRDVLILGAGETVALWGADRVEERYGRFMDAFPDAVTAVLDDDRARWGGAVRGAPVVDPRRLPYLNVRAVVLADPPRQADARRRCHRLAPGVSVLPTPGAPDAVELHQQAAAPAPGGEARPEWVLDRLVPQNVA